MLLRTIQIIYYLFHCCLLICMNKKILYFLLRNINQGRPITVVHWPRQMAVKMAADGVKRLSK